MTRQVGVRRMLASVQRVSHLMNRELKASFETTTQLIHT